MLMIIPLEGKEEGNKKPVLALLKAHIIKHATISNARNKLAFFKRITKNYSSRLVN